MNLAEMNNVHVRTEHVDQAAYRQLLDTWYAVVEELGVMAARMDDVGALYELTRFVAHGEEVPNGKTWKDAAARAFNALKDLRGHSDEIEAEVVARMCNSKARRTEAKQAALLEVGKELMAKDTAGVQEDMDSVSGMRTELRILTIVAFVFVGVVILDKMMPMLRKKVMRGNAEEGAANSASS